jgi:hypothetical protein
MQIEFKLEDPMYCNGCPYFTVKDGGTCKLGIIVKYQNFILQTRSGFECSWTMPQVCIKKRRVCERIS